MWQGLSNGLLISIPPMADNIGPTVTYPTTPQGIPIAPFVVKCTCENVCDFRQCKSTEKGNYGRWFFTCAAKKNEGGCGFFRFMDEMSQAQNGNANKRKPAPPAASNK